MRIKIAAVAFCCLLILSVSSCRQVTNDTKIEVIAGVTCIHNTNKPLHPEKTVRFVQDLVIGGENEEGEVYVYRFYRFFVSPSGEIYIPDHDDKAIKVFGKDGKFIKAIGREGQGPGEFQYVNDIGWLPDGMMLVMDNRSRRTSVFTQDGSYVQTMQWKSFSGIYSKILLAEEQGYFTEKIKFGQGNKDTQYSDLVRFNLTDGADREILTDLICSEQFRVQMGGGRIFGAEMPQASHAYFAEDSERGMLFSMQNDQYLIFVYDKTGQLLRKIDREYEALPFTKSDKDEFYKRFDHPNAQDALKEIKKLALPRMKKISQKILIDDLGNLWIKTQEQREDNDKIFFAYDIFDTTGYFDARVWSDLEPDYFVNGKMYRLEYYKDGTTVIKRYDVIWEDHEKGDN